MQEPIAFDFASMSQDLLDLREQKPWAMLGVSRREYEEGRPWEAAEVSRQEFESILPLFTPAFLRDLRRLLKSDAMAAALFSPAS